ncbi:MAG: 16S rRNA (guanine(527)-N(7))-methyltransferase RsmG [Deltaproteobacteria bacterium]|nr:16S rRNA (guanine(527)-N(7))-methyltransferase RsmG [Deltaproteobacteria bacterium]
MSRLSNHTTAPDLVRARFTFPTTVWDRFRQYVELLQHWNQTYRLVGSAAAETVWDLHIADSLLLLPFIPETGRLVDLGSGAGLPGIPLQIVRNDLEVVLVEPQQKRINFCEEVKRRLGLSRLRMVRGRAEQPAVVAEAGRADIVVSRATWQLSTYVRYAMAYRQRDGRIIAMKGPGWESELVDLKARLPLNIWSHVQVQHDELPQSRAKRALLIF